MKPLFYELCCCTDVVVRGQMLIYLSLIICRIPPGGNFFHLEFQVLREPLQLARYGPVRAYKATNHMRFRQCTRHNDTLRQFSSLIFLGNYLFFKIFEIK